MTAMRKLEVSQPVCTPKRYRFGLRWLLVVLLIFALAFSLFGRASYRVVRQERLLGDLARLKVVVRESEPTGLALLARKLSGDDDAWLRDRINGEWLRLPSVLVTWTTTDKQIPELAGQIRQLGTVHELHVETSPMSAEGLAKLRNELPQVVVLTRTDLQNKVRTPPKEHFAFAALEVLALFSAVAIGVVVILWWPMRRR